MKTKSIKPNLTSQIRHELITPLTCILSLLGSLGRTRISEQQANYLHDIEDSVASITLIKLLPKSNRMKISKKQTIAYSLQ